jgi:hypothetical protein
MAVVARADIEALLRARKLDTTLAPARPLEVLDERYVVPTGIGALDMRLAGGLARGQMSEIAGARSSGCTSVMVSVLASAASQGELVALVDAFDSFDPSSAHAHGLDLSRLLWVRGSAQAAWPASPVAAGAVERQAQAIDRALKSFNLVLRAGGFGVVALDISDALPTVVRRLPFTTWLRLQRPVEGSSTVCLLVAGQPVARSAGGVTVALQRIATPAAIVAAGGDDEVGAAAGGGVASTCLKPASRLFAGLSVEARIARSRGVAESCRFDLRSGAF